MAIYKLYQIHLTNEEIDIINASDDHRAVPKNELRMRIGQNIDFDFNTQTEINDDKQALVEALVAEAFEKGYYEHVSNITADGLEDVFEVGNIGPESNIERFRPMHSVSVGDVIEDENGVRHKVASFGFEEII